MTKKPKPKKKVEWQEGTVDNEHLMRKKSKCKTRIFPSIWAELISIYLHKQVAAFTASLTTSTRALPIPRMKNVTTVAGTLNARKTRRPPESSSYCM